MSLFFLLFFKIIIRRISSSQKITKIHAPCRRNENEKMENKDCLGFVHRSSFPLPFFLNHEIGFRWVIIYVLVSEPVSTVEDDKKGRRQPHGPGVDVVTDGFGSGVYRGIHGHELRKKSPKVNQSILT